MTAELGRPRGRVDVHAHVLPGLDDGCRTIEESIACGRLMAQAGYSHVFCTPHVWLRDAPRRVEDVARAVEDLQRRYRDAGVPLTLMPGGEINLLWSWPQLRRLKREEIVSYNLAGRWLLFDFWADSAAECIKEVEPGVRYLREQGFELVLAHPERIAAFYESEEALDRLLQLGVHLQMNTWCLTDPPGLPTRDLAERWLKRGLYFLIGSDVHHPDEMPPRVRGLTMARQLAGEAEADRLTIENPRRVMEER